MKIILLSIMTLIVMSACSTKKSGVSEYEYQRSNAASEKALDKLDRE
jgi:uncharacterized protein YceK